MEQALAYRDCVFLNFRHFVFDEQSGHGFRWVDVKRFGLSAVSSADDLLVRALIRHDQFRDDYAGGGVDSAGTRHGPYQLDRITVEAYESVGEATALGTLSAWAGQHGVLPEQLKDALEREVYALVRAATSRYRLKALGEAAFHDWGRVHVDFHEFVVVDRVARSLAVIVAADD